jgi:hypothetical protein
VRGEFDGSELGVVDLDALGIFVRIKLSAHLQACIGGGGGNELDDGAIAAQRLATPVDGDEREEPVLDFVPLTGAWRQMADGDGKFEFIGKLQALIDVTTVSFSCRRAMSRNNRWPISRKK